jgi:hypothetical protein
MTYFHRMALCHPDVHTRSVPKNVTELHPLQPLESYVLTTQPCAYRVEQMASLTALMQRVCNMLMLAHSLVTLNGTVTQLIWIRSRQLCCRCSVKSVSVLLPSLLSVSRGYLHHLQLASKHRLVISRRL